MTTIGLTEDAVAKLQKTLDFITEHPERHRQGVWLEAQKVEDFPTEVTPDMPGGCGTFGCVAGWLAMHNFNAIPTDAWRVIHKYDYETGEYTDEIRGYDFDYDQFPVAQVAREALGIEPSKNYDAYELTERMFDGDRTLPEIWFLAQELADHRLTVPASVTPKDPYDYEDDDVECDCEYCI